MQIMVRTRGLGRPTIYAHRQQQEAHVEDPFTTAEELNEEKQQQPVEEGVTNVEGFLDGPHDTLVLRDFENLLYESGMERYQRPELKLSSHERKAKFSRPAPEIEGLVAASGLRLKFAFVEHLHKETSSFHLLVREVTITLDDVASLLHLPIIGAFHNFEQLYVDDVVNMLVKLLEVSAVKARAEMIQCHDSYCWIYKYFPSIGSAIAAKDYDERRPRACRWTFGKALPVLMYCRHLDRLTPDVVCWIPYDDHRSFREFKTILPYPALPSTSIEEMDVRWMQFGDYIAPVGQIFIVPGQCSLDYMQDPPRVPLVQQYGTFVEPDVSQQSMAATAPDEPDVDVHRPRHAVDGYVAIDAKLERLLNLRILTEGTEAYTVAEECLTIARSYIGQPIGGHRSRCRRCMDDH
ncbi:hypothetical protein HKD37_04G011089 [Glycine soja]